MAMVHQIVFVVVALVYTVSSKGYGPTTGGISGNIGGIGGRPGGNVLSSRTGSFGGGVSRSVIESGGAGGRLGGSDGRGAGGYIGGVGLGGAAGLKRTLVAAGSFDMSPKPYNTGYQVTDEQGGVQYRSESSDGKGKVQGSYGYSDSQGLYRNVEYVADELGFKANIKTNEPGVGKDSPADVNMIVEQAPHGIQEQYTPNTAYGTGISGGRSAAGLGGIYRGSGLTGRAVPGGYQGMLGSGMPGSLASGGYQKPLGGIPGVATGVIQGDLARRGATGATGSGVIDSGLFAGIPKSSTGKSSY